MPFIQGELVFLCFLQKCGGGSSGTERRVNKREKYKCLKESELKSEKNRDERVRKRERNRGTLLGMVLCFLLLAVFLSTFAVFFLSISLVDKVTDVLFYSW